MVARASARIASQSAVPNAGVPAFGHVFSWPRSDPSGFGCLALKVTSSTIIAINSSRLDLHDPRHRLDRAGDLRRDFVAAGKLYLHFGGASVQDQDHADLRIALRLEPLGDAFDRLIRAHEHAQDLLQLF